MIRRLLAASTVAALVALAAPAQATPPPAPILDIMDTFKTEVAHGTLTQAQYNQLETIWDQGTQDLMDNAVRSIRRSPLTDPAARQAVQNAEDDMAAAFKSQDAGATIDTVLGFGQSAALTYGEPVADLATQIVEDYLSLQEKLLVARKELGNADPAQMQNLQHTLDKENEQAAAELNEFHTIMTSVAGTNASSLTPAQRARAVDLLNTWYSNGMPPPDDGPGPPELGPPGDQPTSGPQDAGPPDTSRADAGAAPAGPAPAGQQPDHTAANAANRQSPMGNGLPPTPDTDPGLFPSRGQPPQPPPQAQTQAPPSVDRLPTQPPPPPDLDPVKVVIIQHPDNQTELGTQKYTTDANGNRVLIEYDDPSGGATYYKQDAKGNPVPAVYVDADGHSWGYDAQGRPTVDLDPTTSHLVGGGGGGAGGGSGNASGFSGPGTTTATAHTVKAQFPPPDTSGYPTFDGLTAAAPTRWPRWRRSTTAGPTRRPTPAVSS